MEIFAFEEDVIEWISNEKLHLCEQGLIDKLEQHFVWWAMFYHYCVYYAHT